MTQDIEQQLTALSLTTLTPIVRKAIANEEAELVDWSFCGLSAIGEDLGTQIGGNLSNFYIDPTQAKIYYQAAFDAYLDGLHLAGWDGNINSVRFVVAASASLRYTTFPIITLKWLIANREEGKLSWIDKLAQKQQITVEEALQLWGATLSFLFDMADEARELTSQLN